MALELLSYVDATQRLVRALRAAYLWHFQPEPDGGYTVTCPSLPPVVTYAETLDEARNKVREAIELCLEVYRDEGKRELWTKRL